MSTVFKTPGVYIDEKSFPLSILAVNSAVPVFIGYTEIADDRGRTLVNVPFSLSSLVEYELNFGGAFTPKYKLVQAQEADSNPVNLNGKSYNLSLNQPNSLYLYSSIRLFFANGGARCYILSIGTYKNEDNLIPAAAEFVNALSILEDEAEPSIVVLPDAITIPGVYEEVYQ